MVSGDQTHACGRQYWLHCCFGNCGKDVKILDRGLEKTRPIS